MNSASIACPVCGRDCLPLPAVDFNKSCEEVRGKFLPPSGIPIVYVLCTGCQFCFAPEFAQWTFRDFEERIYNQDYALFDPDYLDIRPRGNAEDLDSTLGEQKSQIRHLDFGGGNGMMSRLMREAGWQSFSYDPFVDRELDSASLGQFNLITAFEVFEHVPDASRLVRDLSSLLAPNGIILFTTVVSDDRIVAGRPPSWWYAAPRNGHISLFSKKSLAILAARENLCFGSFSDICHIFWRHPPAAWAACFFPGGDK